jgi:ring-1,2-phenylacetyl-CoA epoxidase subunit PaaC
MNKAVFEYVLRLGDTTLILAQRLSEWCAHGPALEEDLALTNTSLDLLGQARLWLTLAGEVEGAGRDEDNLAYLRHPHEYRNMLLVEQPNGHYGDTLARQLLFDVWHYFVLEQLVSSEDERIAAIASKSLKEVTYHVRRSSDLVIRLGDGTPESHDKMQASIDRMWRYTGELFIDDSVDEAMTQRGLGCSLASLRPRWLEHIREVLHEATLVMPDENNALHPAYQGGRQGRHTEALSYLLAEMQSLPRAYPGAVW